MNHKKKQIKTEDGSITYRIEALKENYHSLHGAVTESRFVYLTEGFNFWTQKNKDSECNILELGYGTGLMSYLSFLESDKFRKYINYTSLEPYPLKLEEVYLLKYDQFFNNSRDLMTFNKFSTLSWEVVQEISPYFKIIKNEICFEDFKSKKFFDLIYYDAFGAHAQPELWEPKLMKKCYSLLKPGGVWVSYCAKGSVRRGLKDSGFSVFRLPGPPGKREMLRAVKE
jgi:tRNA U34 5-methylaminomethyl-2-thiouridine-forming methyltransferase MnmC|tara:strand:+ start:28 stop:708 length:681 start_codon:yes stop_codon:yes gene_type:complete